MKGNRCPWTSTEKDAAFKFLSDYIKKGIVLGKKACMEAIDKSGEVLAQRSWQHVKFAVKNSLTISNRMLK